MGKADAGRTYVRGTYVAHLGGGKSVKVSTGYTCFPFLLAMPFLKTSRYCYLTGRVFNPVLVSVSPKGNTCIRLKD